jgi:signal transduction histidine kinase
MDPGGQLTAGRLLIWPDSLVAPHELVDRARRAARWSGTAHRLDVVCPTDLPLVRVDEQRMAQVLGTLIGNALRLTPAGEPITVGAMRAPRCHEVIFFVRDSGPGISAAEQPFVFARRRQAIPRPGEATSGLGLAACKDIVEGHGGRIYLASRLGEGATFCCALPAHHEARRRASGAGDRAIGGLAGVVSQAAG